MMMMMMMLIMMMMMMMMMMIMMMMIMMNINMNITSFVMSKVNDLLLFIVLTLFSGGRILVVTRE